MEFEEEKVFFSKSTGTTRQVFHEIRNNLDKFYLHGVDIKNQNRIVLVRTSDAPIISIFDEVSGPGKNPKLIQTLTSLSN